MLFMVLVLCLGQVAHLALSEDADVDFAEIEDFALSPMDLSTVRPTALTSQRYTGHYILSLLFLLLAGSSESSASSQDASDQGEHRCMRFLRTN